MDNNHRIGVTVELYTAFVLSSLGNSIYFPFLTQSKCDLLIEKDGKLSKVQVKKATKGWAGGNAFIQIRLQGSCGLYQEGDFDTLAMVYEERLWLFPWEFVKGKTSMSFSIFEPTGKSKRPRRNISQYEISH